MELFRAGPDVQSDLWAHLLECLSIPSLCALEATSKDFSTSIGAVDAHGEDEVWRVLWHASTNTPTSEIAPGLMAIAAHRRWREACRISMCWDREPTTDLIPDRLGNDVPEPSEFLGVINDLATRGTVIIFAQKGRGTRLGIADLVNMSPTTSSAPADFVVRHQRGSGMMIEVSDDNARVPHLSIDADGLLVHAFVQGLDGLRHIRYGVRNRAWSIESSMTVYVPAADADAPDGAAAFSGFAEGCCFSSSDGAVVVDRFGHVHACGSDHDDAGNCAWPTVHPSQAFVCMTSPNTHNLTMHVLQRPIETLVEPEPLMPARTYTIDVCSSEAGCDQQHVVFVGRRLFTITHQEGAQQRVMIRSFVALTGASDIEMDLRPLSKKLDVILSLGERIHEAQSRLDFSQWRNSEIPEDLQPDMGLFVAPNGCFAITHFRFDDASVGSRASESLISVVDLSRRCMTLQLCDSDGERLVRAVAFSADSQCAFWDRGPVNHYNMSCNPPRYYRNACIEQVHLASGTILRRLATAGTDYGTVSRMSVHGDVFVAQISMMEKPTLLPYGDHDEDVHGSDDEADYDTDDEYLQAWKASFRARYGGQCARKTYPRAKFVVGVWKF